MTSRAVALREQEKSTIKPETSDIVLLSEIKRYSKFMDKKKKQKVGKSIMTKRTLIITNNYQFH